MSNFPSKWYDFINHKELKRLRHDIKDSFFLRIEIATSIVLVIITAFFARKLESVGFCIQIIVCIILCVIVILMFLMPFIIEWISIRRHCNVFIKGKDAISIFDDEIIYDILVANEYYNSLDKIPDTELRTEIEKFYKIEIKYYISSAIENLYKFNSNAVKIFGDDKNKIPLERIENIINLIDKLKTKVTLNSDIQDHYTNFCATIQSL